MKEQTKKAAIFTDIVLETFKFNGLLIAAGDGLTKELGLTSALWQVLGAVRETPLPMAQIARNMGLSRQGVRRSANILLKKKLIQFKDNPDHKRAKLVVPTSSGRKVLNRLEKIQVQWSNCVSQEFSTEELTKVSNTIKALGEKL